MIKFGVARKYAKDLKEYITKLIQNNVDAYEMGFAYGIPKEIPAEVIDLAKKHNFTLSCHLPFWINLGNSQNDRNVNYLVAGLKIADQLNYVAVFHLGFYGNKRWDEVKYNAKNIIKEALETSNVKKGMLGIETTGKQKEIGTINEVIELLL